MHYNISIYINFWDIKITYIFILDYSRRGFYFFIEKQNLKQKCHSILNGLDLNLRISWISTSLRLNVYVRVSVIGIGWKWINKNIYKFWERLKVIWTYFKWKIKPIKWLCEITLVYSVYHPQLSIVLHRYTWYIGVIYVIIHEMQNIC